MIFVEDAKAYTSLHAAGGAGLDARWVLMTGVVDGAMTLEEVRARGRAAMADDPEYFDRIRLSVLPEQRAILYLTSGATGEPKFACCHPLADSPLNVALASSTPAVVHRCPVCAPVLVLSL